MNESEKGDRQMQVRQTMVERSIEAAVQARLRTIEGYAGANRAQRERLETEVREAVRLRWEEDEV